MQKKEHYRGNLPHFQQPGQCYFITCSLLGAIPKSKMRQLSIDLETAKTKLLHISGEFSDSNPIIAKAKSNYQLALKKYRHSYDILLNQSLNPSLSLLNEKNLKIMTEALLFWEGKKLESHAWCIMSNHFHWVVSLNKKDELGKPIYLQDVLHSVKLYSARNINKSENREGQLWFHESFETTIRNDQHFYNVVKYTINNPVSAGLIKKWENWKGTYLAPDLKKNFASISSRS